LTAWKLSRRIVEWMPGHTLLKHQTTALTWANLSDLS
jgi:hypothetical protein